MNLIVRTAVAASCYGDGAPEPAVTQIVGALCEVSKTSVPAMRGIACRMVGPRDPFDVLAGVMAKRFPAAHGPVPLFTARHATQRLQ